MTTYKDIRQAMDTKIARWETRMKAMEAQLDITKQQALERLQDRKQQLIQGLNTLNEKIEASQQAAGDLKDKLQQQIDELRVQLALGMAETKDAYTEQRDRLTRAITDLEELLDDGLDKVVEESDTAKQHLINGFAMLDAELEAVELQFQLEAAKAKDRFEEGKSTLQEKIKAFHSVLAEKRQAGEEKLTTFESDLVAGMKKIKDAFSNLMH